MCESLPKVIVVGNEKGGSGKSTLSFHFAVAYMYSGYKVATIDLDGRQGTLTHYIENRINFCKSKNMVLPIPEHLVITPQLFSDEIAAKEDMEDLDYEIDSLKNNFDIIIIDTPGTYNHLSNAGHKNADILITPVNDSLLDLDVIAKIDVEKNILEKSHYTKNVEKLNSRINNPEIGQEIKQNFKWIVLRNRVAHIEANNKKEVDKMLKYFSEEIGFKYLSGIGERVIYRELFLKGLTISDIVNEPLLQNKLTISHIAAKNELTTVMNTIGIPIKK